MPGRNISQFMPPHQISIAQTKAARTIQEFREALLNEHGLTSPEWFVLGYAAANTKSGGIKVGVIARELGVQSTYVTGILRKLEDKKLIQLETDKQDHRARNISTTKHGQSVFKAVEKDFNKKSFALFGDASDTAIRNYFQVLETISTVEL